ncbi:MAG: hypothetical protein HN921_07180 [Bacteroidetes bacterium]|jgi:uncharacterized protein (TIGR02145 family)|nr:hypothetical protein [Bacteroidota bacterium]MBT7039609.1 hypothetical protein [Bacteroidota bacterium]
MKKIIILSIILCVGLYGFAQSDSISNITASQRTDGSGLVDVYFDLYGSGNSYYINMRVSFDAGANYFPVAQGTYSGDIASISSGTNKHIVWNPTQEHPNRYSPQTKIKLVAFVIENINPCPGTPTVTDYDGNIYATVQIDNQCWMASNLNTTRDAAGNIIIRLCYDNNQNNCEYYGGLYDWNTVMNGAANSSSNPSGVQGICPIGWHVPSDAEWTQLTDYLINNYVDITSDNVGDKLKSCRQVNSPLGGVCNTSDHPRWDSDNTHYGTNDFGFGVLPGGGWPGGSWMILGQDVNWWCTTTQVYYSINAMCRTISSVQGEIYIYQREKSFDFSVRCLKN